MAKITLSEPKGLYTCTLDTDLMTVVITDVYLGMSFVTKEGETLSVSMRDGGFGLFYTTNKIEHYLELNDSNVKIRKSFSKK